DGFPQRGFDLPALRLGLFASFSEHFACRADGKLEIYGVPAGSPNKYRGVDPLEGDVTVTGDLHHLSDRCLVRHRKWSRPTGESILTRWRQKLQDDILGHAEPRIGVARTPNNMSHDPARFQCLPHVSQSCHRVGEKHRSEARKDQIILGLEVVKQRITIDERNILQAKLRGVLSAVLQERFAAILPDNLAVLARAPRELNSGVAKTTAN